MKFKTLFIAFAAAVIFSCSAVMADNMTEAKLQYNKGIDFYKYMIYNKFAWGKVYVKTTMSALCCLNECHRHCVGVCLPLHHGADHDTEPLARFCRSL